MRGYLLVEEPGPWGPGGLPSSRLGEEVTAQLRAVAARRGVKPLLVRRPSAAGRDPAADRAVFLVDVRRGRSRVLVRRAAPGDVAAAAAEDGGWREHPEPLLLVCTHGRKDWCCAVRGRPVVQALAALDADVVWECSHLGGDRFAATTLALPSGVCHGHVDADLAPRVLAGLREGRVLPAHLRGRTCDAMVAQAAEGHLRLLAGEDALDAVVPRALHRRAPEVEGGPPRWDVEMELRGEAVRVRLAEGQASAHRLTCSAEQAQHARTWDLLGVDARADAQQG